MIEQELAAGGVKLDVQRELATVTLDRPETRNAMTPATWRALAAVGASLPAGVRVVVLRAEGKSFSAGLDRRMLTPEGVPGETSVLDLLTLDDAGIAAKIGEWQEGFSWWRRPGMVTIAAVQGHAVGGGFQLALACDLRVVADDAQFSMREPALGLVPDLCGTRPLVDCVGYARALEICVTTRWVFAEEAVRIGLASVVVARAELDGAASELAAAVLTSEAGAVSATKGLLLAASGRSFDEQRRAERETQVGRLRALAGSGPGG